MNDESIVDWHREVFPDASDEVIAAKLLEEAGEAYEVIVMQGSDALIAEEIADLYIVVVCAAGRLGIDLPSEVAKKMTINKKRVWTKQPSGYYTRDKA